MVDFLTAAPEDKISHFLNYFNNYNPALQFTIETENNIKVVLLLGTIGINDTDNKIILNWYMKPTNSITN